MNSIAELHNLGQSIWYDNIERRLLHNGELAALVAADEIRGLTSNPSIFYNAIARSSDYDAELATLAPQHLPVEAAYERLAIADIRSALALLRPLYDRSHGADGYVSLEVNPLLALDDQGTLVEARRLWAEIDAPNLMIKIPATLPGLKAVRSAIAAGINVNVTLIFSLERYRQVMEAYLAGLEERQAAGLPIQGVASVASFFISRMDSKVDRLLDTIAGAQPELAQQARALRGRAAVANARLAYEEYRQVFAGPRFAALKAAGGRSQRPLWASTSTKNPAYPDTLYVDSLIGPDTVNTMPPQTLVAFREHGVARLTIAEDLPAARQLFEDLEGLGISLQAVTDELEQEGVQAFVQAYQALLEAIRERCRF